MLLIKISDKICIIIFQMTKLMTIFIQYMDKNISYKDAFVLCQNSEMISIREPFELIHIIYNILVTILKDL